MPRITVNVSENVEEWIESEADTLATSKARVGGHCITVMHNSVDHIDLHRSAVGDSTDVDELQQVARELRECQQDLEHAEARRDELRRQLSAVNSRQEDVGELVEYVEEERSYREAGLATRAKWWLFGKRSE